MDQTKTWVKLPNIDKDCFGCGSENTHGLNMTFETNGEKLKSRVIIPDHLRGWSNIVHGGVLTTIADEIMAWSAIHLLKRFILTRTITTTFLKPVFIGTELTSYGVVKERVNEKSAMMSCEIYNADEQLCVKATGDFALFTSDEFEKFNLIPQPLLEEMARLLADEGDRVVT